MSDSSTYVMPLVLGGLALVWWNSPGSYVVSGWLYPDVVQVVQQANPGDTVSLDKIISKWKANGAEYVCVKANIEDRVTGEAKARYYYINRGSHEYGSLTPEYARSTCPIDPKA